MTWKVAGNIAKRIRDLCEALGVDQKDLAPRAGVHPQQVSAWVTGKQRPTRTRLESWAIREGWPVAIFAEGGPMPLDVVKTPVNAISTANLGGGLAPATEPSRGSLGPPCHTEAYAAFLERLAELVRLGVPSMTIDEVRSRLTAIKEELDQRAATHSG
jgi:transcriptional regulator with XRE-family HTH domain